MKNLIPLAVCVLAASALYLGFPELRVDRDKTACHGQVVLKTMGQAL